MTSSLHSRTYRLPGGRATVSSRRSQVRALLFGMDLFGPSYLRLVRAASSGDSAHLRRAEQRWARRASRALDLNIEKHRFDHIDPQQQYIVMPLHEGFADVLALLELPMELAWSVSDELFEWRVLGRYLRAAGHAVMPSDNGAVAYRSMVRAAETAVTLGQSFVVFPQGSILGIEIAFHQGAFRLAAHTGLPILPIVLTGAATVWEHPYSPNLNFGETIRIEVLAPIPASQVVERSQEIESDMKNRALAATPSPRHFDPLRDGWWDDYPYDIDPAFPLLAEQLRTHRSLTPTNTPQPIS